MQTQLQNLNLHKLPPLIICQSDTLAYHIRAKIIKAASNDKCENPLLTKVFSRQSLQLVLAKHPTATLMQLCSLSSAYKEQLNKFYVVNKQLLLLEIFKQLNLSELNLPHMYTQARTYAQIIWQISLNHLEQNNVDEPLFDRDTQVLHHLWQFLKERPDILPATNTLTKLCDAIAQEKNACLLLDSTIDNLASQLITRCPEQACLMPKIEQNTLEGFLFNLLDGTNTQRPEPSSEIQTKLGTKLKDFTAYRANNLDNTIEVCLDVIAKLVSEGNSHIGIITDSRKLTRHLIRRATNRQIAICDKSGWRLQTLAINSLLLDLLRYYTNPMSIGQLNDLILTERYFSPWLDYPKLQTQWQKFLTSMPHPSSLNQCLASLEQARKTEPNNFTELYQAIVSMHADYSQQPPQFAPLEQWLNWLEQLMSQSKLLDWYDLDPLAPQLLELLEIAKHNTANQQQAHPISAHIFSNWLVDLMQQISVRVDDNQSSIELTNLAQTHAYQAIIFLSDVELFNLKLQPQTPYENDYLQELNIPSASSTYSQSLHEFSFALANLNNCHFIYQGSTQNGQMLELPGLWHVLAQYAPHDICALNERTSAHVIDTHLTNLKTQPRIAPPTAQITKPITAISASGYQELMQCPYRYFVKYQLYAKTELIDPERHNPLIFGSNIHQRLQNLWDDHIAQLDQLNEAQQLQKIKELLGHLANTEPCQHNLTSMLKHMQFIANLPHYLAFELNNAEYYRPQHTEKRLEKQIEIDNSHRLKLVGIGDRFDRELDHDTHHLIDYKMSASKRILSANRLGEDLQLLIYLFLDQDATCASYVHLLYAKADLALTLIRTPKASNTVTNEPSELEESLKRTNSTKSTNISAPIDERRILDNIDRLKSLILQLATQSNLPANATSSICARCTYQNICLRNHWDKN